MTRHHKKDKSRRIEWRGVVFFCYEVGSAVRRRDFYLGNSYRTSYYFVKEKTTHRHSRGINPAVLSRFLLRNTKKQLRHSMA